MTSIRHNPEQDDATARRPEDVYLDAARDAILAVGWSRTTLTDIARRAGVSRMTLYRRWPDTQTLLADLMTREWGTVVERAAGGDGDHGAQAQESTRGRISRGLVATVQALRDNPLLRRIIDVDPEVLLPYLLDRRGRSQEMVAQALAALVAEGQRDGSVRDGDPVVLARSLVLAAHGFTLSAHTMLDETGTGHTGTGGTGDARDANVSAIDVELGLLVDRYLQP
jgi:AcrR family transcriptional regulator